MQTLVSLSAVITKNLKVGLFLLNNAATKLHTQNFDCTIQSKDILRKVFFLA
jgi:hypothetical protein